MSVRPFVASLFLVSACGGSTEPEGPVVAPAAPAPVAASTPMADHGGMNHDASKHPYDQMFIDMMIPHHQGAVEMTAMADLRAEHPELKEMAKKMHDMQDEEIAKLRALRTSWYGSPETPSMDAHADVKGMEDVPGMKSMKGMKMDIASLNDAKPFDKAFLDAMIPHHEGAVEMATDAQNKAEHAEIKEMAAKMVADQQKEIAQMKAWRSAWYPEKP